MTLAKRRGAILGLFERSLADCTFQLRVLVNLYRLR